MQDQYYDDQGNPVNDPPPPTGAGAPDVPAPGNDDNAINGYYSTFLGRSATPAEVTSWRNSGLSLSEIQNRIANSAEAQAYAAKNSVSGTKGKAPAPAPDPTNWNSLAQSTFGAMPGIPNAPAFQFEDFQTPAPFQLPSGQQVLDADPGYQFRVGQGSQALQQSAAARGVLNTGGTLQNLVDYGQSAASQEYQNAADRAQNVYNMNFNDALQAWLARAGNALTTYNTNYQTQYQNPYLAAMGQYGQRVANQGQLFNQQFQTATA